MMLPEDEYTDDSDYDDDGGNDSPIAARLVECDCGDYGGRKHMRIETGRLTSVALFSKGMCREAMRTGIEGGCISEGESFLLEEEIESSGLPEMLSMKDLQEIQESREEDSSAGIIQVTINIPKEVIKKVRETMDQFFRNPN